MARILLIEDHAPMRHALRLMLEQNGHQVAEAADGKAGLARYEDTVFDLVITDLIMPEMEGVETVIRLRKFSPHLKIIAISAGGKVDADDYLAIATKAGADRTLAKPFETQELLAAVNELLGPKPER